MTLSPFYSFPPFMHCLIFVVLLLVIGNLPPMLRINLAIEY